jgi:hypothetical protein
MGYGSDEEHEDSASELGDMRDDIEQGNEDAAMVEEAADEEEVEDEDEDAAGTGTGKKGKRGRKPGSTKAKLASGKATAKGKAKAKDSESPNAKGVKRSRGKVVGGKKLCRPCRGWHLLDLFPQGSSTCGPTRRIIQNLSTAAGTQGQEQWWVETQNDEAALGRVVKNYKDRLDAAGGKAKAAGSFPIAQYVEEVKRERQFGLKRHGLNVDRYVWLNT